MTPDAEPHASCGACDGQLRATHEPDRYVCIRCGAEQQQRSYAGGPPGTFADDYTIHDAGERHLLPRLHEVGADVELTGYDPHHDGQRVTGGRTPDDSTLWDIEANGIPIDIKSTRHTEHHGNVREYHWQKYPPETWVAAFVVRDGEVVESGAYRKCDVEPQGTHDGAHAETWVEVAREDIRPLDELLRAVGDAETDAARFW